jgi:hypothetical protein
VQGTRPPNGRPPEGTVFVAEPIQGR